MKTFIGITGTTSVGKSAVAVQLAKLMNTEIISADSMQIYKGMDIGTAKISCEEMQGVVHHMLNVADPNEDYSAYLYSQQASRIIDEMPSIPIVVGGTGFYFDCLVYPPEYGNAPKQRREELMSIYAEEGLSRLQQILTETDAAACRVVDMNNYKRVIRAIEIAESGASRSVGSGKRNPRYNMLLFVLQRDRQDLYNKIDKRVDDMISRGLVDEVRRLVDRYGVCDKPAFEAIGYKEIIGYLQGVYTLPQAIELIKINTRHYAKRQIAYYKRMGPAEYIDVSCNDTYDIAKHIYNDIMRMITI